MKKLKCYNIIKVWFMLQFISSLATGCNNNIESENVEVVATESESEQSTVNMPEETTEMETTTEQPTEDPGKYDFTLCFAGDISLADDAVTTARLGDYENDLSQCISPELLTIMKEADLMCINNEFTFSTNGSPLEGKMYTFRAHPSKVSILEEMGVDIALLANNHVYDYGEISLLDTLETLNSAGIKYFGAGKNLDEAMSPVYFEIDGKTIAYVAASRAEKYKMTPQATDESAGILRCYDPALFIEVIKEADANADFVIANVHWGTEYSTVLEEAQLTTGKQYIEAGADVIIGSHSHCLQGMEYYNGKPIIYSLGNYWFNNKTLDSMLIQLHFSGDSDNSELKVEMIPAIQSDCRVQIITDEEEKERMYSYMEDISINIEIDENGIVTEDLSKAEMENDQVVN